MPPCKKWRFSLRLDPSAFSLEVLDRLTEQVRVVTALVLAVVVFMAGEPVVAVDFLGLGTTVREREIEKKAEEIGQLVKSTSSLAVISERSSANGPSGDDGHEIPRPRLALGTDSSNLSGHLTISLGQATSWGSKPEKAEEMEDSVHPVQAVAGKRMEDLSESDIMQLSGDECRRYMMMMMKKEREIPRPASSFAAAPGPPTSQSRFQLETRNDDKKLTKKRGGSSTMGVLLEASNLSSQSGSALQLDAAGSSGGRSALPARWHSVQSQPSQGDDAHVGATPSERAVQPTGSNAPNNQDQPFAQPSGFGSPLLPNYLKILRTAEHSQRPLQANQSAQGSAAQLGVPSRSTSQNHLPGRPPTAQLTIFYSGMVNVYDGVPADKAQAIMLLAGSGSSWSSSVMSPPPSVSILPSTGGMASSSNSPARTSPAAAVACVSQAAPVTSLVPTISVAAGLKPVAGRPTLHAELPQARKASLARFLEKRKDRVRGKAPYVPPIFSVKKDVGSSTPPREKSPAAIRGNSSTRSPSPAASLVPRISAVSRNQSSSPLQPSQLNDNSTCSPQTQQLVGVQQGPHHSSSEDQASTSATQRRSREDLMDWRSQQLPQQKLDSLEETGSPSQHQ